MSTTMTGIDDSGKDMAIRVGNPVIYNTPANASYAAGNQTYLASDILSGVIVHDGTGGDTGTLPTAALMRAALGQFGSLARVGDTVECLIVNGANVSGTLTIAAGVGGSFDANQGGGSRIIAFGTSKWVTLRMTNVTPGSESYTLVS